VFKSEEIQPKEAYPRDRKDEEIATGRSVLQSSRFVGTFTNMIFFFLDIIKPRMIKGEKEYINYL